MTVHKLLSSADDPLDFWSIELVRTKGPCEFIQDRGMRDDIAIYKSGPRIAVRQQVP